MQHRILVACGLCVAAVLAGCDAGSTSPSSGTASYYLSADPDVGPLPEPRSLTSSQRSALLTGLASVPGVSAAAPSARLVEWSQMVCLALGYGATRPDEDAGRRAAIGWFRSGGTNLPTSSARAVVKLVENTFCN